MNIISSLIERGRNRRAYATLRDLDDHLLRDIGISRSEINALERGYNRLPGKKFGL